MVDEVAKAPPSAWIPTTDRIELAILGKGFEELGELISAMGRTLIQGINESDPETGKPNRLKLVQELADVESCTEALVDHYNLDRETITDRATRKEIYQAEWRRMLQEQLETQVPREAKPKGQGLETENKTFCVTIDEEPRTFRQWAVMGDFGLILGMASIGEPLTIIRTGTYRFIRLFPNTPADTYGYHDLPMEFDLGSRYTVKPGKHALTIGMSLYVDWDKVDVPTITNT